MLCYPKRKGKLAVFNGCVGRRMAAALLQIQRAFNRNRLKAQKLIDSKVSEQLIRVQTDAGCSTAPTATAEVAAAQGALVLALREREPWGWTIAREPFPA